MGGDQAGWNFSVSLTSSTPTPPSARGGSTGWPRQQGFPQPWRWDAAHRSFAQGEQFLCPCLNLYSNHLCFERHGKVAEKCGGCVVGFQGSRRDPAVDVSREKACLTLEGEEGGNSGTCGHVCFLKVLLLFLTPSKLLVKSHNSDPHMIRLKKVTDLGFYFLVSWLSEACKSHGLYFFCLQEQAAFLSCLVLFL